MWNCLAFRLKHFMHLNLGLGLESRVIIAHGCNEDVAEIKDERKKEEKEKIEVGRG